MAMKFTKYASNKSVQAAYYGGAFDVDPEMFFTRDDLDELTETIVDHVQESVPGNVSLSDAWIDGPNNQTVHVEVDWSETGTTYASEVTIDMRSIRRPSDLRDKYGLRIASDLIQQIRSDAESYELNGVGIGSATNSIATNGEALQQRIYDAVIEVMQSPEFGFSEEEAKEYSRVTFEDVEDSTRIEVGVEVDFDGMMKISEVLDPIVSEVDPDAYFDFDAPGIMSAYISDNYLM